MKEEEYLTVQDFANRFGVQTSVVRGWVRKGLIRYVLVGPRHIRHVRRSDIVKPVDPSDYTFLPTEKTEEGVEHVGPRTLTEEALRKSGNAGEVSNGGPENDSWDDPVCARRVEEKSKI